MRDRFRVGTRTNVISPTAGVPADRDRIWEGVHDDLMAKALVLDNTETKVALVSLDMGALSAKYVRETRNRIERQTDIAGKNVLIGCTHTHSAPFLGWPPIKPFPQQDLKATTQQRVLLDGWIDALPGLIATAVKDADDNLEDAALSICQPQSRELATTGGWNSPTGYPPSPTQPQRCGTLSGNDMSPGTCPRTKPKIAPSPLCPTRPYRSEPEHPQS